MQKNFALTQDRIREIKLPAFRVGDVVRIHRRVKEGNKERTQIIEGEIIARKHGSEPGATITLRRVTLGIAVELVIPIYSPFTEKLEIVKRQRVRRAKLYYLRRSKNKRIRLKEDLRSHGNKIVNNDETIEDEVKGENTTKENNNDSKIVNQ